MKYVYPDYYHEFECVADRCSDTCCAGWQIVVDEESLDRYLQEDSDYRESLHAGIDWREGVFMQDAAGRCYFLREDNLCQMYCRLGESSLCKTCQSYPRHTEEFENLREVSLSISCPVVAALLLQKEQPVSFVSSEDDLQEEFEEFDYFLFSVLEDTREAFLGVLQNRALPLNERLFYILQETECIQRLYEQGELAAYEPELPSLESISFLWNDFSLASYEAAYDRFEALYDLERLRDNWQELLEKMERLLYEPGAKTYLEQKRQFANWCESNLPSLFVKLEQIAVYFFYLYYPGAVYDGYPYGKADAMVFHVANLYELFFARFLEKNTLTEGDMVNLVYRYSREIEHSDENLDAVEEGEFFLAAISQ